MKKSSTQNNELKSEFAASTGDIKAADERLLSRALRDGGAELRSCMELVIAGRRIENKTGKIKYDDAHMAAATLLATCVAEHRDMISHSPFTSD